MENEAKRLTENILMSDKLISKYLMIGEQLKVNDRMYHLWDILNLSKYYYRDALKAN